MTFLHNDAKLVHSNLCPESIIVNRDGAWKIAGFDFCIHNTNEQDQAVSVITSCFNVVQQVISVMIQSTRHQLYSCQFLDIWLAKSQR